ncbi:hypothetical protein CR513_45574 [Mucuna pruriens]|uniref:Uncharacterized protein n=1 Tax=Mucuna pruriens TaxID=157652 RepID=A0A371F8P0_MUCPR|nr:hypothetical protein CR513_45574 [Mucuna pruriens]
METSFPSTTSCSVAHLLKSASGATKAAYLKAFTNPLRVVTPGFNPLRKMTTNTIVMPPLNSAKWSSTNPMLLRRTRIPKITHDTKARLEIRV